MLSIANVVLPAWQAIFLIVLSSLSLAIALYCLLFMVPLKKFVQRIESLGGGMEGLKKHLSGIESYFENELKQVSSQLEDSLDHVKSDMERRTGDAERKAQSAAGAITRIENDHDGLRKDVEHFGQTLLQSSEKFDDMGRRFREIQRDMSILTQETEGKLKKEVRESFLELEATILATLEVMRDELLPPEHNGPHRDHGSTFHRDTKKKKGTHRLDQHPPENKIISPGPLFSRPPTPEDPTGVSEENGTEDNE